MEHSSLSLRRKALRFRRSVWKPERVAKLGVCEFWLKTFLATHLKLEDWWSTVGWIDGDSGTECVASGEAISVLPSEDGEVLVKAYFIHHICLVYWDEYLMLSVIFYLLSLKRVWLLHLFNIKLFILFYK